MKRTNLSINTMMNQRHLYILTMLFALLPMKALTSLAVANTEADEAGTILIDPWDDIADVSREMNSSTGEVEAIVTYEKVNDVDASLNVPNNSYVHFDPTKSDCFVMYHTSKVLPGVRYKLQIVFAPETKEGYVKEQEIPSKVSISTGYHDQDYNSSNEIVDRLSVPAAGVTIYEAENIVSSQNDFYFTVKSSATSRDILRGTFTRVMRIAEIRLIPNEEDFSTIEDGGIYYTIVPASNYAQVCANPNKYTGEVVIPESFTHGGVNYSVSSINSHAFENCSGLTSITIPSSVTCIGEGAFAGCDHLTTVKVERNQPISISEDVFTNCANATLYVPRGSITAYRAADGWKDFKEIVEYGEDSGDNIIVFADASVKALCVANWDTNGDGELSKDEAAAVKDIGTVFKAKDSFYGYTSDITFFDELQYFTGLTSIGELAFSHCERLTSITIPNSVTTIGVCAFLDCSRLSSFIIPIGVTSIGEEAFRYCYSLTSITIPNSVTSICDKTFFDCSGLTSVTIPNSVTSIGDVAFANCTSLTSITIPNSVTSIGDRAFEFCSDLASITVEEGNPVYDSRDNCNAIIHTATNELVYGCKNTVIPNSVTTIGNHAFSGCDGLTSITIPNSVTSIGDGAFVACSGLTSITIPNSVTSIGVGLFDIMGYNGQASLASITVESGNPVYDSRDNCNAIIHTATNELVYGCKNTVIPNSVTRIGNSAFFSCNDLTSITIPNSVTNIGDGAFYWCSGLTSVTIPNSVTSIGNHAFYGCRSLTSIDIPSSVMSIGYDAFSGCINLTAVKMKHSTPLDIMEGWFNGSTLYHSRDIFSNRANATLYVPKGSKSAYEASEFWSKFKEIVEYDEENEEGNIDFADAEVKALCVAKWDTNDDGELSKDEAAAVTELGDTFRSNYIISSFDELKYFTGLTSIDNNVFDHCSGLTTITIPGSVVSIGDNAFMDCEHLTSINIPNSVTSIGNGSFWFCESLTSIIIPNSVTSIGSMAFSNCISLASIIIPDNVSNIGWGAFQKCSNLNSITVESGNIVYDSRNNCNAIIKTASNELVVGCNNTIIPNNVTTIGLLAFGGSSISTITIPNSITKIGNNAFQACAGLTSITISESVTEIGERAFADCNNLTIVKVESDTPISIAINVFTNRANATLYVPKGCKAAYEAADYWKDFKDIVEMESEHETVTVTANDMTVVYGDEIPPLTYTVEGGELLGEPVVTCEVTTTSGVGTYPIIVSEGTVENDKATYVNGTLTITKAPLTVKAETYTKKQGEENPEFTLTYEGFKNNETEAVLTKKPTTTCTATATSEPGEYEVTVSGGEAQNYAFTYASGTLTIEARPTIDDLKPDDGDENNGGGSDYGSGESGVDENTDLNETVVGSIYYCITPEDGGYSAEEGCLVINKAATVESTETPDDANALPTAKGGFQGLVFFVQAGRGTLKIKAETTGNFVLCVKIAGELKMNMSVEGKTTVTIPYDVSQPSEVLVYAGVAASVRGQAATNAEGALKIYSLEWEPEPTGIDEYSRETMTGDSYYDLSGRKLDVMPTKNLKKGVYIVGGRKVVIK